MAREGSTDRLPSIVPTAAAVLREGLQSLPAAGGPAARSASARGTGAQSLVAGANGSAPGEVDLVVAHHPAEPGDVAYLSHVIQPGTALAAGSVVHATDLIGPSGQRIPASHTRVTVLAGSAAAASPGHLHIEVRVPSGSAHGWYTGYLQADDLALQALLKIAVGTARS
jgi:hypothetical protein